MPSRTKILRGFLAICTVSILTSSSACSTVSGGAPQPEPSLDDIEIISLDGVSFPPRILLINSREELTFTLADSSGIDIDFDNKSAIYVSWYLADTCVISELLRSSTDPDTGELIVEYKTFRDDQAFCPAVIIPFEQLLVVNKFDQPLQLKIDHIVLANWPE